MMNLDNERDIVSPFRYRPDKYDERGNVTRKGFSVKEKLEGRMPSISTIQKMHLQEGYFTPRLLYILQFLYELGPLTQKQIEWAFMHEGVDPYHRKTGTEPYKKELQSLLANGIISKMDVMDETHKVVRAFRLSPSAMVYYKNSLTMERDELFSERNMINEPEIYDAEKLLRSLSASMYALRAGVFWGRHLVNKNRRFDQNGMIFDGKYRYDNEERHYVISARLPEKDYGRVLDALMLPVFKKDANFLVVVSESIAAAQVMDALVKERGHLTDYSRIFYVTDLELKNEDGPVLYQMADGGYNIRSMMFNG